MCLFINIHLVFFAILLLYVYYAANKVLLDYSDHLRLLQQIMYCFLCRVTPNQIKDALEQLANDV